MYLNKFSDREELLGFKDHQGTIIDFVEEYSPLYQGLHKGPFTNYVMHFSLIFDHPPTYGYVFAMILLNIYLIEFAMVIQGVLAYHGFWGK